MIKRTLIEMPHTAADWTCVHQWAQSSRDAQEV